MAMTYTAASSIVDSCPGSARPASARPASRSAGARAARPRPAAPARGPGAVGALRRPRVRLTQRGRLTVFLTVVAFSLLAVFGHAAASADAPHAPTPVSVHVVVSGETLWGVARSVTPAGSDVRDTIIAIEHLNDLSGPDIAVGQQLLLPA